VQVHIERLEMAAGLGSATASRRLRDLRANYLGNAAARIADEALGRLAEQAANNRKGLKNDIRTL
jgi:hypothetical protein